MAAALPARVWAPVILAALALGLALANVYTLAQREAGQCGSLGLCLAHHMLYVCTARRRSPRTHPTLLRARAVKATTQLETAASTWYHWCTVVGEGGENVPCRRDSEVKPIPLFTSNPPPHPLSCFVTRAPPQTCKTVKR